MSKYDQAKVLATEALIGMQQDCLAMQKLTKEEQDSLLFSVTALVRDMLAENARLREALEAYARVPGVAGFVAVEALKPIRQDNPGSLGAEFTPSPSREVNSADGDASRLHGPGSSTVQDTKLLKACWDADNVIFREQERRLKGLIKAAWGVLNAWDIKRQAELMPEMGFLGDALQAAEAQYQKATTQDSKPAAAAQALSEVERACIERHHPHEGPCALKVADFDRLAEAGHDMSACFFMSKAGEVVNDV